MNLLFVASLFYPDTMGGSDRYLYEVTRRLVQNGHKVSVLTANQSGLPEKEIIEGITMYRYSVNRSSSLKYYLTSIFNTQRAIINLAQEKSFDLIILNHILPSFGAYLGNKSIPKIYQFYAPYVLEFKDKISWEMEQNPSISVVIKIPYMKIIAFFIKRIEKYIIWKSKHILALSDFSKEQIKRLYRQDKKVTVIPCGIDINKFKQLPERDAIRQKLDIPVQRSILLTIRRLYHRMGLEELIIAVGEIRKAIPDILLLIGGKGPLRETLQKMVADQGLEENIRFLGFIDEEQITDYYNAADYFILPTRSLEGFGLVTIEALACGVPVLGTPVGATISLLGDLDPVLLFEDCSAPAMAKKIITMIKDYPDYDSLSQRCRKFIQNHYTWEEIIPKITKFYQQSVL